MGQIYNFPAAINVRFSPAGTIASTNTQAAVEEVDDLISLGIYGGGWSNLFLTSGGVINWGDGNYTATHSSNVLTLSGRLLLQAADIPGGNLSVKDAITSTGVEGAYLQMHHSSGGADLKFVRLGSSSGNITFESVNDTYTIATTRMRLHNTGALQMGSSSDTVISPSRHPQLRAYTVATLPSATTAYQLIAVSDGTGNKRQAISDGTNWRFPDGAIVS